MMARKDREAAVFALGRWFETQNISVEDAVPVLGEAMVIAISLIAETKGLNWDDGFANVMSDMREFAVATKVTK
jgi:hypothetical protein